MLKKQAEAASRSGHTAEAAALWRQVAERYPACNFRQRPDAVIRVLNLLKRTPQNPERPCENLELAAARIVRQTHEELLAIPDSGAPLRDRRRVFADLLAKLRQPVREAATFLDGPPIPAPLLLERHAQAVAEFGACPALRSALARHASAAIPVRLPAPPACDPETERARDLLRQTMTAMERAEPGTASATAEFEALAKRLARLDGYGDALTATRVRAIAEAEVDRAAEAWAELALQLPMCSSYLAPIHDSAHAAVLAWQHEGQHRASPPERYILSRALLENVLRKLETAYGTKTSELSEYESLKRLWAALKKPQPLTVEHAPPVRASTAKPVDSAAPLRWIHRHRPEANMIEVGVLSGMMAPSSGLFPQNAGGTHQLFDPYKQREALVAGYEGIYKPYRKLAPEFGLRFAWLPLSFLGGEIEGGVMPTRIVDSGEPTERAVLFNARAHLLGQLPWWRVTPFILIGGGALGTRGALGTDTDPTFNFGLGLKVYASRYTMIRLDLRDSIGDSFVSGAGGTHYPELLLGLSFTLNRRRPQADTPRTTTAKRGG